MFDAKVMLEGILSKCYYKAFNRITEWNENFLKYLRYTVEKCIAIIGNNKSDLKSSFREYVNIRDLLSEAISHVSTEVNLHLYFHNTCQLTRLPDILPTSS